MRGRKERLVMSPTCRRLTALASVAYLVAALPSGAAGAPQTAPPPPARSAIVLGSSAIQDGTRYVYEVSPERAETLPQWDQRSGSEPPLSLGSARKGAEAWLASRA